MQASELYSKKSWKKNLTFSYATSFDFRENHKTCDKRVRFLVLAASHSKVWESPLWKTSRLRLSTQLENTGKKNIKKNG